MGKKKEKLPVKIQGDSNSFHIAESNMTTKLPHNPPILRRRG